MNKTVDQNNPDIIEGKNIYGYCVKRKVELKEADLFLYELEHIATGAKHIHISNNDKENTFSVAFKTVPVDSTGVAHILEHTVLCGNIYLRKLYSLFVVAKFAVGFHKCICCIIRGRQ